MDTKELKAEINKFIMKCAEYGNPISSYCLNPAYPGDSSTSYFFQIKADWVEDDKCFGAIEFLTDVMFEVMSYEARIKIFSIQVLKKNDELHCDSGEITHVQETQKKA